MTTTTTGTSGAKEQVGRLLTLVPYLHARGEVPVVEAAAALGVTPQQVVRDLKVLFMCGLPGGMPDDLIDVDIDALEGERTIRVSNADYLARPLRLTPTEATAVVVALRALRAGATSDATRGVIDRALAKLEKAASSTPLVDPGEPTPDHDRGLRETLTSAAAAGRQVRLVYFVEARDEETARVVDPRGLTDHAGRTYLDAFCHAAEAPRWFRLDRIRSAEVLDSRVTTPTGSPRDLADGLFTTDDAIDVVTLDLAPEAHWVTEYYAVLAVRPGANGHCEVDLRVADPRWLTRLLLRVAPHARVVQPSGYSEAFKARARAARALYA